MKHYRNSDYAVNKYAKGIVYRFANRTVEVTLAAYLEENPDKTESDFQTLKALSDQLYYQQARKDNAGTRKDVSLHELEGVINTGDAPLDEAYIEAQDQQFAAAALVTLLEPGVLTETQRRRFCHHIFDGIPLREIADQEGAHYTSVAESITVALCKLKKFFTKF